jgi:hypothetical protein
MGVTLRTAAAGLAQKPTNPKALLVENFAASLPARGPGGSLEHGGRAGAVANN